MEPFNPVLLPDIFKEGEKIKNEWFLESSSVSPEDYYILATVVAKDSEVLFGTYHNLFSLQQNRSSAMIDAVITQLQGRKKDAESYEIPKIETRIDIAEKFKIFLEKYNWQEANNLVHTLEETLK